METAMQDHAPQSPEAAPEQSAGQMDDINIPLVAVSVAFFACLLSVAIISLQAWFMHADRAEIQSKLAPQEDPRTFDALAKSDMATPLGQILQKQRAQLEVAPDQRRNEPATAPAPSPATTTTTSATASQPVKKLWVPIDTAMVLVSQDYHQGGQ